MGKSKYKFKSKIWIYPGDTAWHFVTIDSDLAKKIKERHGDNARGFGSLPVSVTLGKTKWKTSIFPSSPDKTYLLPIKKAVRDAEGVFEGDLLDIEFNIR